MPRSSSVTNCGGVTRARSTFHHSSAFRVFALADLDTELALVGRPFQDVEQLLAGGGRPGFLLGDGEEVRRRSSTQDSMLWLVRSVGLRSSMVLSRTAATCLQWRPTGQVQRLTIPISPLWAWLEVGLDDVGLRGGTGHHGAELVALDFQVADQVDVGLGLVDVAGGKPIGDIRLAEGGEG